MRITIFVAAVAFIVAGQLARPACATPPETADFVSWAMARGAECDEQWKSAAGLREARAASDGRSAIQIPVGRMPIAPAKSKTRPSIDFCPASGLTHTLTSGVERLSLNTRQRQTPTRGLPMLSSPTETRLNQVSAEIRSFSSALHWTRSFHTTKSAVRPMLKSFGRLSQSARMGKAARPASRASRPVKF